MLIKLISDVNVLRQHENAWNTLAGNSPFYSHAWNLSWLDHLAKDLDVAVLVGETRDGNWEGIAPFVIETSVTGGRKLRFIGSGKTCTDYVNLITTPARFVEFADAISVWLAENCNRRGKLGYIDSFELEGIKEGDSDIEYFIDRMRVEGWNLYTKPIENCWVLELPTAWNELQNQLPKSLKRKTKKASKRLESGEFTLRSSRTEPLNDLWPIFCDLHQKRRTSLGEPGCFADPNFESFLFNAVSGLACSKQAELIILDADSVPFASLLLLSDHETAFMYQSGIDPEKLKLEPGYAAYVATFRTLIEQGFKTFDFLRGDEPYKARWNTQAVKLSTAKLIPPTLSAQLRHQVWTVGKTLRDGALQIGILGQK